MGESKGRLDLLVIGLPRGGTTLIANLLTNPKQGRWCMVEPGDWWKTPWRETRLRQRASDLGWDLDEDIPDSLDFWGIKEVEPERYSEAFERFRPKRVLLVLRNAVDCMASLREMHLKQGRPDPGGLKDRANRLVVFASLVERVVPVTQFRYESLSEESLAALSDEVGVPLDGDPNRLLGEVGRSHEIRRGVYKRRVEGRDGSGHGAELYQKRYEYDG